MEIVKNLDKSSVSLGCKPCPFCSCHAVLKRELFAGEIECFYISCEICGARGEICGTKEDAVKKWNTRKKPYESRRKLPCPKCGKKPDMWYGTEGKQAIICKDCSIGSIWSKTEIGAIRDWNKVVREWTE